MDYPNGLPKWTALKWTTPKNNIPNEYYLIFLAASRYKFRLCSSSDLYSHVDHWKIDRDNADVNAGKQSIVFVGIVWSETYIYSNLFFFSGQNKKKLIWLVVDSRLVRDSRLTWARRWLVQCYNSQRKICLSILCSVVPEQRKAKRNIL